MEASNVAGPSNGTPQIAAPQWRQFTFFDTEEVKDADDLASSPQVLKELQPTAVICSTSPLSPLPPAVIISSGSVITFVDRHFARERSFTAWDPNRRATALEEAGGILIGIGEEEGTPWSVLKIWDLTREAKRSGGPVLMRSVRIQHGQRPSPVSCMAITSNLSHLALGLGDGTVLLYRHLLQSLTTSPTALTSLPRARVLHESTEPITGLGFREPLISSTVKAAEDTRVSLFVVTTNRVLVASASAKGGDARAIDDMGCGLGCASMDWERKKMIVARDEAVYVYNTENREACLAYEGPKSSISVFRDRLIITSPPFYPSAGSASSTVRHYVSRAGANGDSDIAKVTILDLENKLVSYSATFRQGVRTVFSQWTSTFVLETSGKLSRLDEHSTTAKLDVLYRRNLYSLAISLAHSSGLGPSGEAEICRRYGDFLYTKGDFDAAMSQFVKTLGYLQPSYVIRKYLDAQRIHNLTTYLQELHARSLANPDHTTLLLNCYTKTADRTRLDAFIRNESSRSDDLSELPFDLDTAIRVCRQAGFYEHATYLAKKYGQHENYLRIQIEDAQEWDDALKYLRSLGPDACEANLLQYGRLLLQNRPEATTESLIDLCAGNLGRRPTHVHVPANGDAPLAKTDTSGPAMLSYLGYNRVTGFLAGDNATSKANGTRDANKADQPGARQVDGQVSSNEAPADVLQQKLDDAGPSYDPPSPRQYFAHFLDHSVMFVHFLESVAQALWGQRVHPTPPRQDTPLPIRRDAPPSYDDDPVKQDQRAVWNALLELYLTASSGADHTISMEARDKALGLLADSSLPYDPMHALILCSTIDFKEGLVKLWESMGMYEDVLRFYMHQDPDMGPEGTTTNGSTLAPSDEVLRYLDLYGSSNPHLYPLVLRYLSSSSEILSRHSQQLGDILETIDEERIMPPLAIVQLLSRNGVTSVGSVKQWLKQRTEGSRDDIDADRNLIDSYRSETAAKEKEIKELSDTASPEVFQVTRCAACGGQLDLPSVHFMCKHSYHQRCLSDAEPECVLCARQHSIIREVRRNQTRLADRHDLFVSEVHDAEDGFSVVAGAYGRGVMGRKPA